METTIVYWGYLGVMENEMETTNTPSSSSINIAIMNGLSRIAEACQARLRYNSCRASTRGTLGKP